MSVSYKKLWGLLLERGFKKNDLRKLLSPATVCKLNHNKMVSFASLIEICRFLHCDIGDIVEVRCV